MLKTIVKAGQTCQQPFLRWLRHLVNGTRLDEETHSMLALPPIDAAAGLADPAILTPGIGSIVQEFGLFSLRRHTSMIAELKPGLGLCAQNVNALASHLAYEPTRRRSTIAALVQALATGSFVHIQVRLGADYARGYPYYSIFSVSPAQTRTSVAMKHCFRFSPFANTSKHFIMLGGKSSSANSRKRRSTTARLQIDRAWLAVHFFFSHFCELSCDLANASVKLLFSARTSSFAHSYITFLYFDIS